MKKGNRIQQSHEMECWYIFFLTMKAFLWEIWLYIKSSWRKWMYSTGDLKSKISISKNCLLFFLDLLTISLKLKKFMQFCINSTKVLIIILHSEYSWLLTFSYQFIEISFFNFDWDVSKFSQMHSEIAFRVFSKPCWLNLSVTVTIRSWNYYC